MDKLTTCTSCGTSFWQDQPWKKLCVPCWRKSKEKHEYRRPTWEDIDAQLTRSAIPSDMLKRLIRLCHPDRHNGSEAATRATQWLLEQRRLSA